MHRDCIEKCAKREQKKKGGLAKLVPRPWLIYFFFHSFSIIYCANALMCVNVHKLHSRTASARTHTHTLSSYTHIQVFWCTKEAPRAHNNTNKRSILLAVHLHIIDVYYMAQISLLFAVRCINVTSLTERIYIRYTSPTKAQGMVHGY